MTTELKKRENQELSVESTERTGKVYVPRADIYEAGNSIVVLADMPGVSANSVDITLEKNILTISGTVEPLEFEGHNLTYGEYNTGDYRRVFSLSNEVDREGIEASVRNGVLKLVLPKSKASLPKKIAVKSE